MAWYSRVTTSISLLKQQYCRWAGAVPARLGFCATTGLLSIPMETTSKNNRLYEHGLSSNDQCSYHCNCIGGLVELCIHCAHIRVTTAINMVNTLQITPWALLILSAPAILALAVVQQQCSADPATAGFGPRYHIPDEGHHLQNVKDVLVALGYTPTNNPADANVIWAWADLFVEWKGDAKQHAVHQQLKRLTQYQLANQFPGMGYLATKAELGKLSSSISAVPPTFQLPHQYQDWQRFTKTERGAAMQWVEKSRDHRGIKIIPNPADPALQKDKRERMVQQLIRPYLIDEHLWDLGVYVAVTSLAPLTAYMFTGSALLRFCSQPYEHNLTTDTDTSKYIIHGLQDYMPGNHMPSLQPYYDDAAEDTDMGSTIALAALRGHLSLQGVNISKWWLNMQSATVQALQAQVPKMEELRSYYYPAQRTNFFALLRFDFMLDEQQDVYLLEVNMSPGLYHGSDNLDQQLLSRKLVHDVLSLKGLAPGGRFNQFTSSALQPLKFHTDATAVGMQGCGSGCATAVDCNTQQHCKLCKMCQSQWQRSMLSNVVAEHQHAGAFMRIHPPHRALAAHMTAAGVDHEAYFDAEVRPDDALLRLWLQHKCEHDYRWC